MKKEHEMKINYLTTSLNDKTGGAAYDESFYGMIKEIHNNITLIDDQTLLHGKSKSFLSFSKIYRDNLDRIFNADILILNSRLYTRFLFINNQEIKRRYPNLRIIMMHHHNNYMNHSGLQFQIHKYLELKMLHLADELVIPNQYVAEQLRIHHKIFNIIFLRTALEKKKYKVSSLDSKQVLFVGNIQYRKGLDYGIKAFRYLYEKDKEYKYLIIGNYKESDRYYKKLNRIIKKLHLENAVSFLGRVDDERLDDYYSHAEIFLYPSLLEGYGLVIMEAMGRGVPVICFNNSAIPYSVKNKYNGFLIDNKNYHKMGKALVKLAFSSNRKKKYQQGAVDTFNKAYSKEDLRQDMIQYIKSWE
jgi:glycosyltransferase involved in cell wall biosynthesis